MEEVQDKIRRTIGEQNALQYAVELLGKVRVPMESYFEARSTWEVNQMDIPEGQEPSPPPTPPNLEELVGDLPLTTSSTELLSVFELFETPLGSSVQLNDSRTVFAALTMADPDGPSNLFQPFLTQDGERNLFLSWKVADEPERVPSLEEIRDQVVQHWKTGQAQEKAKQRAEELATSARKLGLTLQESLAEMPHLEVGRSEAFTWLTGGPVPRMQSAPLRLSEIEGIEGADSAFMEQVFQLETGEITAVENHARDVVYVVRLASRGLPLDALRDRFSKDYQMAASLADRSVLDSMRAALIQQVSQDAEVEIIR